MKTIETEVVVSPDGTAVIQLQLPADLPRGKHRAVVVVEEQPTAAVETAAAPLDLIPLPLPGWPKDSTFRREDLYADDR